MLSIEIKTGNSAYLNEDGDLVGSEIARQLRNLADEFDETVFRNSETGTMNDINGNKTLCWSLDI